jgi:uncharacterized repeat protein (TIGR03806 family)
VIRQNLREISGRIAFAPAIIEVHGDPTTSAAWSSGATTAMRGRIRRAFAAVVLISVGFIPPVTADDGPRREPIGPYLNGAFPPHSPAPTGGWATVVAFPRLTFEDPILILPDPRGGRLYVGSRQGIVWSIADDANAATKSVFLDLRQRCQGFDDGGLLALAFHPRFGQAGAAERGYVYIFYNYSASPTPGPDRPPTTRPTRDRLSRFTVPDGSDAADPNSELVLIDQLDENMWHNGGGMFFHPEDGFLYLSLGDEGGDYGNTQRIDKDLFSGVIRIDVDRRGGAVSHPPPRQPRTGRTAHYLIPSDNPWVGRPDTLEEFWCIGLRSPHRMTYDAVAKRIWLGDVGESSFEEIDWIERGGNYQWRYREGAMSGPDSRPAKPLGIEKPPVHQYPHRDGSAVIGGYVYRGAEHAESLGGKYVFGDNGGRIWAMTCDGRSQPRVETLCDLPMAPSRSYGLGLSSFGEGRDRELYLCQLGHEGRIYRLARTGRPAGSIPATLAKTGAFRDLRTLRPSPGLVAYQVNSPLWSDGAAKSRWVAVPNDGPPYGPGELVGFAESGSWSFPDGTVFVKHFELGTGSGVRRLETRFLVRSAGGGAYGVTYRWRSDGSDADLIDDGADEVITVETSAGRRRQTWHYPSRRECLMCHTTPARHVLGVNTRQLNRGDQLASLSRIGMFDRPLDRRAIGTFPRLASIDDTGASLEHRARSYLDANCAHCHRPGAVRAHFDASYDAGTSSAGPIGAEVANALGTAGARVIVGGDATRSIAARRIASTDPAIRMPPLASNVVDERGVATMRDWIGSLEPRPTVRLIRPSPHAMVASGQAVAIEAEVVGARPAKGVEFFAGETRIGVAELPPFRLAWKDATAGSYSLSARVADGTGTASASEAVMITVVAPSATAAGTEVFLSDLRWQSATSGYGPVERDRSNGEQRAGDGRPLSVGGKDYAKGLGVHANSRIDYRLGGAYTTLLAEVGVDDEAGESGSVTFEVWADGAKLFESGPMRGGMPAREVKVGIAGRSNLTLIVTDAGDGIGSDHADWADARLVRSAGAGRP